MILLETTTGFALMVVWPAGNDQRGWHLWVAKDENDRETGVPE